MGRLQELISYVRGPHLYGFVGGSRPGQQHQRPACYGLGHNAVSLVLRVAQRLSAMPRSKSLVGSLAVVMWYRGWQVEDLQALLATPAFLAVAVASLTGLPPLFIARGVLRSRNADYKTFMVSWKKVEATRRAHEQAPSRSTAKHMHNALEDVDTRFIYDASHRPYTLRMDKDTAPPLNLFVPTRQTLLASNGLGILDPLYYHVTRWLAYTVCRPLMYPGSMALLNFALHQSLTNSRCDLFKKGNTRRHKVLSATGQDIDCIHIDRRGSGGQPGTKLFICCEGNASFYEIGVMHTPLKQGFSVLGWNRPGFGCSTGIPDPATDAAAVQAVVALAAHLGWSREDVFVYGWSIGGFTAAWAGAQYPDLAGVVVDATFAHVMPLACLRMPGRVRRVVEDVILLHFNLCPAHYLVQYKGPIHVARRLKDSIMCTQGLDLLTNCGNDLIADVLHARYGKARLCKATLELWFAGQRQELRKRYPIMSDTRLQEELDRDLSLTGTPTPSSALTLNLLERHTSDHLLDHQQPLLHWRMPFACPSRNV